MIAGGNILTVFRISCCKNTLVALGKRTVRYAGLHTTVFPALRLRNAAPLFCSAPVTTLRNFSTSPRRRGLYTPEDLPPPGLPVYPLLNIRMRGYDFTVLEHHMYYVTKLASAVGAEVVMRWVTPSESRKVTVLKPQSNVVENEYNLTTYERNVQIANVTASTMPLLLDTLNSTLPEGVTLTLKPHEEFDEEFRHIPDYALNKLQAELDELSKPKK